VAKRELDPVRTTCACGSGNNHDHCCDRYIVGGEIPETAEELMRSRYSAFVRCDEPYLLTSWHPDTRPSRVRLDEKQRWLGLRICTVEKGGPDDASGTVEFVARYKIDGKGYRLHEVSRFEKIGGRWYYLDGEHL
jgi:SEC-C motif-containing protein